MRKGKLITALLGALAVGTSGLLMGAAHASQRTTFGEALRDGYEVRALAFVPTEASSRQTGEQTPDALILTLQKESSVVVCYYTLAAYVSDDVMEIESCKAHAPDVAEAPPVTAETEAPVSDAAAEEPLVAPSEPEDESPAGEATAEEPGDAPGEEDETTEPDGPEVDADPEVDDETPADAEAE